MLRNFFHLPECVRAPVASQLRRLGASIVLATLTTTVVQAETVNVTDIAGRTVEVKRALKGLFSARVG